MNLIKTPRYGLHVIQSPSGRFIYVGTVPAELEGKVFGSREEAINLANEHGYHVGN